MVKSVTFDEVFSTAFVAPELLRGWVVSDFEKEFCGHG